MSAEEVNFLIFLYIIIVPDIAPLQGCGSGSGDGLTFGSRICIK
jgi:hypothetical protein